MLSGDEEAQYTYRGALATLEQTSIQQSNVVLDIGGGSTEIALGKGNTLRLTLQLILDVFDLLSVFCLKIHQTRNPFQLAD